MDDELLEDLRGYKHWTLELDSLAVRASQNGRLSEAVDHAQKRFDAGIASSSNSSRTVIVPGAGVDGPVFEVALGQELRRVLGEFPGDDSSTSIKW